MEQPDRDLLIRISEQVSNIKETLERDRVAYALREAKSEAQARQYRIDTEVEIKELRDEVKRQDNEIESLRTSRAQFYAVAFTISFLVGILIKVFWK